MHGKKGSRNVDLKVFTLIDIFLGEAGKGRVPPHIGQSSGLIVWKNTTIWNYDSFLRRVVTILFQNVAIQILLNKQLYRKKYI